MRDVETFILFHLIDTPMLIILKLKDNDVMLRGERGREGGPEGGTQGGRGKAGFLLLFYLFVCLVYVNKVRSLLPPRESQPLQTVLHGLWQRLKGLLI